MPFQRRRKCIFHWRGRAWQTIWDRVKIPRYSHKLTNCMTVISARWRSNMPFQRRRKCIFRWPVMGRDWVCVELSYNSVHISYCSNINTTRRFWWESNVGDLMCVQLHYYHVRNVEPCQRLFKAAGCSPWVIESFTRCLNNNRGNRLTNVVSRIQAFLFPSCDRIHAALLLLQHKINCQKDFSPIDISRYCICLFFIQLNVNSMC